MHRVTSYLYAPDPKNSASTLQTDVVSDVGNAQRWAGDRLSFCTDLFRILCGSS